MNIALIGYGKMGKMVEQAALAKGHTISAIVDPFATDVHATVKISKSIKEADLGSTDAAIEFTQPDTAVENILALAKKNLHTVVGTTDWYANINKVSWAINQAETSMIWASNFSIGVNMFYRIAWYAAELANNFPEYDVGGFEIHHNKKIDSPSGTAKILAKGILSRINRKKRMVWETMNKKPEADQFHFPSMRMGNAPGTHSLFFDSLADTIEITHTARTREGFASGAVMAAEWLKAEERYGVFTIDDMMNDLFKENL